MAAICSALPFRFCIVRNSFTRFLKQALYKRYHKLKNSGSHITGNRCTANE